MKNKFKIIKNNFGFFEINPKPQVVELEEYYNSKYFQNQSGNYRNQYSGEEFQYLRNKDAQKEFILNKYLGISNSNLLDVGCGEGFTLAYFKEKGWEVTGIDFSYFGIKNFNNEMINYFIKGDLFDEMEKLKEANNSYDVIILNNLLEHVINPERTVELASNLLSDKGVLIIVVPNDFSNYQMFLKKNNFIEEDFWVAYPDHLNYFTKESLSNLLQVKKLNEVFCMSDFPIDFFLSNIKSNYILNKNNGNDAHNSRILMENFMNGESIEKTIKLYASMAEIGLGRQIVSFFKKVK